MLVKDPKIIFLDEPTSGLDPKAQAEMNALLRKLNQRGIAIVVSSHILSEIKDLCSKIAIMKQGRLVAYDTIAVLTLGYETEDLYDVFDKYYQVV
jgi:ABC-2 type transport system ATP-binding protein